VGACRRVKNFWTYENPQLNYAAIGRVVAFFAALVYFAYVPTAHKYYRREVLYAMVFLSISAAARATGKDRGTIHRYLKNGRLSSVIDATGHRKIDTSELLRVFGELKTSAATIATGNATINNTEQHLTAVAFETLRDQLNAAQEREIWLKNQLEAMFERNHELEQKILALPEGTAPKPGWLGWLFKIG
jgi:hypothetical protein